MYATAKTGSDAWATRAILGSAAAATAAVAYVPWLTSRFVSDEITCPVRLTTGWLCPFCGMTHATVDLLHGQIGASLGQNAFAVVYVLGLIVMIAGSWGVVSRSTHLRRLWQGSALPAAVILAAAFVTYSVGRNLTG